MTVTFDEYVERSGFDPMTLNSVQKAALTHAWEASNAPRAEPFDLDGERQRAEKLGFLRGSRSSGTVHSSSGGGTAPASITQAEVYAVALGLTAGVSETVLLKTTPAEVVETARNPRLRGFSFHGLVREAMAAAGEPVAGKISERHVRLAFGLDRHSPSMGPSTIDVPGILSDLAGKVLLGQYQTAPAPWRLFAAVRSVSDFKTATALRPSFSVAPLALPPGGNIEHGKVEEESYEYSVATYARQLGIDRTQIVNDDLSAFDTVLPAMGRGAARVLNDLVAQTILANAGTFWGTGNKNYFEGAASPLSIASLGTAVQKLREMKDSEGNLLDLAPSVLLVPAILESTGRSLLESTDLSRIATSDNVPTGNVFKGFAQLAVDPRLGDAAAFAGSSSTAWWLFSAPEHAAVVVAFLEGQQQPVLESFGLDHDPNRLAMAWRVYHDFGCSLGDFRASIKSKGTT